MIRNIIAFFLLTLDCSMPILLAVMTAPSELGGFASSLATVTTIFATSIIAYLLIAISSASTMSHFVVIFAT
jgi:hypothetical protein